MIILTSIAKVLMGLFVIALVLAFITAIFLLGAIVATLGTATQPLFGRDRENDEPEMVNHPDHYNRPGQKECIIEMEERFGTAAVQYFCLLSRYKYLYRCGLKDGATQELSKANWYKDKFLSLGGDDKLLKIVPDNANATAYQQMGGNACIEKEAMSHESCTDCLFPPSPRTVRHQQIVECRRPYVLQSHAHH